MCPFGYPEDVNNLEIAQAATLRPIQDLVAEAGLSDSDYDPYGRYKAKLTAGGLERLSQKSPGKLVLVTAITPTPAGEGKTTTCVGLAQGLCAIGKTALPAIREPALGPIFGIKGGACGGGYSQVLPMEDINLFFTGDFPAVAAAHNLLSALLDTHLNFGNAAGLDVRERLWPRTVDMNDRALRQVVVGLGGKNGGVPRQDEFVITPASEVMATLGMARDLADLKERLGDIVIGSTRKRAPVRARDIQANGAMAVLLRDAVRPNLVQTLEGGPALVHGGPFANIAHGCSSVSSLRAGLGMVEFTITEGGFAADLGAQKFLSLIVPRLGKAPDAIVLVATLRALAHHGEGELDPIASGCANLFRHAEHLKRYGPPVVIALNRFAGDSDAELEKVVKLCAEQDLVAVIADPAGSGGVGCRQLAQTIADACATPSTFEPIYRDEDSAVAKLDAVVRKVYGGDGIELSGQAERDLAWCQEHGYGGLPVCIAKTQYSLSADPALRNAPTGFKVPIREVRVSAGAGFLVALAGEMLLMPGLGKSPAALQMDVDAEGRISGMY